MDEKKKAYPQSPLVVFHKDFPYDMCELNASYKIYFTAKKKLYFSQTCHGKHFKKGKKIIPSIRDKCSR